MNNLINNQNNFGVNFKKKFKCVGLLVLLATLTGFTVSKAMQEAEMVQAKISQEDANELLLNAETPEAVKLAIEAGADVNAKDNEGYTSLHWACENGNENIVSILLKFDADIYAFVEGFSSFAYKGMMPLHIACAEGHENIIELLLQRTNIETPVKKGGFFKYHTPLHIACFKKNKNVVRLLLQSGANVNSIVTKGWRKSYMPLFIACEQDDKEIVELLLEHGANPDVTNKLNYTPDMLTKIEDIKLIIKLVSNFLKKAEKGLFYREKFVSENKEYGQFLEKVRKTHLHNGNKKMEQVLFENCKAPADCSISS